jgi:hypothetical protein
MTTAAAAPDDISNVEVARRALAARAAESRVPRQPTLPLFEDLVSTYVELAFSGKVAVSPEFETDAAFLDKCLLGRTVRVTVYATVVGGAVAYKLREEEAGDEEVITSGVKLKVHSVEFA